MRPRTRFFALALSGLLSLPLGFTAAKAQENSLDFSGLTQSASALPPVRSWMNSEIGDAWAQGYLGQGTRITIVDDFRSRWGYFGNLGTGVRLMRHGGWVRMEAGMIAPGAALVAHDFTSRRAVRLSNRHLDTLNLSYGMMARDGFSSVRWSPQEASIISYARNGNAVVVKAAGNDAVPVGTANARGLVDYLNRDLIGAQSAIFVGALSSNGSVDAPAVMARYSNTAGDNPTVQNQFLTVGVRGDLTGLYGTSFAAPIVSGYAAVLGSKFTTATPTQIANRLLDTARTDTIAGYDPSIHGRGESSIARALAPAAIQ